MRCKTSGKDRGAFAIDAVLGLTFFMLTILAFIFVSMIIRVQANMQYALGQTAKEISGYFYLMDKFGFASVITGTTNTVTSEQAEKMNSAIGSIIQFSSEAESTVEGASVDWTNITDFSEDVTSLTTQAQDLCDALRTAMENSSPLDQMKMILQVFGKTMISSGFSAVASPLICNCLMPKYLAPGGDLDAFYETTGIDPDSVNFQGSGLLMDGRSVKLCVRYTLNTKRMTFGMIDTDLHFRQVATTAAWIRPENGSSKKKITEIALPADTDET